jgi:hypothetical protein
MLSSCVGDNEAYVCSSGPKASTAKRGSGYAKRKSGVTPSLHATTSMLDITQSRDWEGRALAAVRDWVAVCVCKSRPMQVSGYLVETPYFSKKCLV